MNLCYRLKDILVSEPAIAPSKLAYGVDEAVKASGLGRTFLYEHIASGDLPSVKIGRRRLILHHELMNFLSRTANLAGKG